MSVNWRFRWRCAIGGIRLALAARREVRAAMEH